MIDLSMLLKKSCFVLLLSSFMVGLAKASDFRVNPPLGGIDYVSSRFLISNDGERVYFSVTKTSTGLNQLFSASITSPGKPILLNKTVRNAVSVFAEVPNQNKLLFTERRNYLAYFIYSVGFDGSNAKVLDGPYGNGPYSSRFSPDGNTLLFGNIDSDEGLNHIYMRDLNSDTPAVRLDTQTTDKNELNWLFYPTHGFERVVYQAGRSLFSASISDNNEEPILLNDPPTLFSYYNANVEEYKVSPDGKNVAFLSRPVFGQQAADLYVTDVNGGDKVKINPLQTDIASWPQLIEFTPDNESIVYLTFTADSRRELYVTKLDGGETIKLTSNTGSIAAGFDGPIFFGANANKVIYRKQLENEFRTFTLMSAELDGSSPPRVLASGLVSRHPIIQSDDGRDLVYYSPASGDLNIINLETMDIKTLKKETLNSLDQTIVHSFEYSNKNDYLIIETENHEDGDESLLAWSIEDGKLTKISREFSGPSSRGFIGKYVIPSKGNRVLYTSNVTREGSDLFSVDLERLGDEEELCIPVKNSKDSMSIVCL